MPTIAALTTRAPSPSLSLPLPAKWAPPQSRYTSSSAVSPAFVGLMVATHARNSVSVQLDESLDYFVGQGGSGLIGFQDRLGVSVVLGDPLCAPRESRQLVMDFLASRPRARSRALFASASAELTACAAELGCSALKVGEEAVFDLDRYSFDGGSMKRLRHHEGRARRNGVEVVNIPSSDMPSHPLAERVDGLIAAWLSAHAIGPLGFLLALRSLHEPGKVGKRVFVAQLEGEPIALLTAVPLPAANGVYLEDYVRGPEVPDGTAEVLFHKACNDLRARGYGYVSLGTAPLAGLSPDRTREHRLARWALRTTFDRVSWPYDFKSLRAFKARFHPTRWVPKYLVYERPFTLRSATALALAYLPLTDLCSRTTGLRRSGRGLHHPAGRRSHDVTTSPC